MGVDPSTLVNCILYYNTAPRGLNYRENHEYWIECNLNHCCTTPLPAFSGVWNWETWEWQSASIGNISAEPQLVSASHLSAGSPCRGAGGADAASGTDIDGEVWATPPSIGCDEYHAGTVTGPLSVSSLATYTNVAVGFPVGLTALIEGRPNASVWDFGDAMAMTNQPFTTHAWRTPGDYTVVLRAYNDTYPAGVATTVTIHVVATPVHYVAVDNPNPVPPYTSCATAARNIQDAVDAFEAGMVPGAWVVVSNGVYLLGGRAVESDGCVNRVVVGKPLTVRSVNGPQFTVIDAKQEGRCVYLAGGASLSGFTLTNGLANEYSGGGVWCECANAVVSNCVIVGNWTSSYGGGAYGGTLNNCTLRSNWAGDYNGEGGGAYGSILNNCTLATNSADYEGGGAYAATLNNCRLTDNSANSGGGAAFSTLNNCTLADNWAEWEGGGANHSTLNNCSLSGNSAGEGGGAYGGALNNCTLTANSADSGGGAASGDGSPCILNHCTLTGNSASYGGGAASRGWIPCTLNNCIVYFNTAATGANYDQAESSGIVLNYCCTVPLPTNGAGNITLDPQLASASHLSLFSPCRGAGSATYTSGVDIDGEVWATPPSIGCDEYHAGAVTGPLSVDIAASYTNVAPGYPVGLTALIEGRTTLSIWDFGDGTLSLDQPYETHAWTTPGEYEVSLWVFNESHSEGVSSAMSIHVDQGLHYVAADSADPVAPYASWATAARTIQDAVDAAGTGGTVLVTNGTYAAGGRTVYGTVTNRVAVIKPLTLRSVNGPQFTVVDGARTLPCVYLGNGASLCGFTLTNGARGVWCESTNALATNCVIVNNSAFYEGGGAYSGTLYNCVLTSNSAGRGGGAAASTLNNCALSGNSAYAKDYYYSFGYGGGAAECTLNNCTLIGNSAYANDYYYHSFGCGGGVAGSTLNNCTLAGNSAFGNGGGSSGGTLNNCIVYFNTATNGANNYLEQYSGVLNYCCTSPMPTNGVGNITNAPLFVDFAGGDLRLQSNSPCINAGNNAYAPGPTDLDGLPRIVSGTVDMGAYECQSPAFLDYYTWLQSYGLPTDASAAYADSDSDGLNNWHEWRCGTCPTNVLSALRLLSASRAGTSVTVTWQSVAGVNYFLEWSTRLAAPPCFTCVATNLAGQSGATSYTDTNAAGASPRFYRVGVGN
jgi:hypothetical protein